jgi:hypothetical protein
VYTHHHHHGIRSRLTQFGFVNFIHNSRPALDRYFWNLVLFYVEFPWNCFALIIYCAFACKCWCHQGFLRCYFVNKGLKFLFCHDSLYASIETCFGGGILYSHLKNLWSLVGCWGFATRQIYNLCLLTLISCEIDFCAACQQFWWNSSQWGFQLSNTLLFLKWQIDTWIAE